jgi:hypothetical protein
VFAIANFGQIKRRIDVLLVSKGQFMSLLLCVVLSFLFCLLPNFLFHNNLMRSHIVTLVLDAEKVLTMILTSRATRASYLYIYTTLDLLDTGLSMCYLDVLVLGRC